MLACATSCLYITRLLAQRTTLRRSAA
jgi:hypothetical protein